VAGSNHLRPSSELWWALTQPRGNLAIRLSGYVLSKVFRHIDSEIESDVASAVLLAKQIKRSSKSESPIHVVIAPEHRSFYDFLIVSYICFLLPELGLDVPQVFIEGKQSRDHTFVETRTGFLRCLAGTQ